MRSPFGAPAPRLLSGSSRTIQAVELPLPPGLVFEFVTNPAQWHRWHPPVRAVRGAPDRPLRVGESVVEPVRSGGGRLESPWTVTACEPPAWWEIRTQNPLGAMAVTYRLAPTRRGTWFERTCEFRSEGLRRLLDGNLRRALLAWQGRGALRQLRRVLREEADAAARWPELEHAAGRWGSQFGETSTAL